ncbi:MAG: neutral/alkaline non-lysosomal ceramidase N-terminal domain-containing protein [Candidatus Asgardarchaeia archaeon]
MLLMGFSKADITPPVGMPLDGHPFRTKTSVGVNDPLFVRSYVFDDGEKEVVFSVLDVLSVDREFFKEVSKIVYDILGIGSENLFIAATHTHSGPIGFFPEWKFVFKKYPDLELKVGEEYTEEDDYVLSFRKTVMWKTVGSIIEAHSNKREVLFGSGSGEEYDVGKNRRDPNGPMDPQVGVIRLDDKGGGFLSTIVNFSCHPTVLGRKNLLVSADYPAYTLRVVEKTFGGSATFTTGAAGDISTRYTRREHSVREAERLGSILGGEVVKTLSRIKTSEDVSLDVDSKDVELGVKKFPEVDEVEEELKIVQKELEEAKKKNLPFAEVERIDRKLVGIKLLHDFLKSSLFKKLPSKIKAPLKVIKFNDTALVGIPGELFVEIGLHIKEKSEYPKTFIVCYANDYLGYLLSKDAYEEEEYETYITRFDWSEIEKIERKTVGMLKR